MDLPKDKAQELLESQSRRNFLKATGGLAAVVGIASGQLNGDNQGNISVGTMALEEAYQISDKQWIGPDSAKANVEAKSGRLYKAVDTEVEYYGDSGSWTGPLSVGSSSQPVPSINTEKGPNNVRNADPGQVQSKIDELANLTEIGPAVGDAKGLVQLDATKTYSGDWTLKPGVFLGGPALIQPDTDTDVLFCDNGTRFGLGGPLVFDLTNLGTFSSSAVVLNTTDATVGKYGDENAVRGRFVVYGDRTSGQTGLELDDDAAVGITTGCEFHHQIYGCDVGVRGRAPSGGSSFINGVQFSGHLEACNTFVKHDGGAPMDSQFSGTIQVGSQSGAVVVQNNAGSVQSLRIEGRIFDLDANDNQLFAAGENITLRLFNPGVKNGLIRDASDNSPGQILFDFGREELAIHDLTDANSIDLSVGGNSGMRVAVNGTNKMSFLDSFVRADDQIWLAGSEFGGLREVDNATASDVGAREVLVDPTNSRLIVADSSGTANYITFDGAL